MLSSRSHSTLLLLSRGNSTWGLLWSTLWDDAAARHSATWWRSRDCKLRLTQDSHTDCLYLTWESSYIISQRPHISTQLCSCFCLFSLARPVQRISDWRLGQYARQVLFFFISICFKDASDLNNGNAWIILVFPLIFHSSLSFFLALGYHSKSTT